MFTPLNLLIVYNNFRQKRYIFPWFKRLHAAAGRAAQPSAALRRVVVYATKARPRRAFVLNLFPLCKKGLVRVSQISIPPVQTMAAREHIPRRRRPTATPSTKTANPS